MNVNLSNVFTYVLDISSSQALNFVRKSVTYEVDTVLSDLAPNITGIWEVDHMRQIELVSIVIDMIPNLLRAEGNAVLKIFQGDSLNSVKERLKGMFEKVLITKPSASRKESSELYLLRVLL